MSIVKKEVHAFYPCYHAQPDEYKTLRYDLMTALVYGQVNIRVDGTLYKLPGYDPSPVITYAHDRGTKVLLMFNTVDITAGDTILTDSTIRSTAINNLLSEVKINNFDGIYIDIERVTYGINTINGKDNKQQMTDFITILSDTCRGVNPNYFIQMSVGNYYVQVDLLFDLSTLQNKVNYVTMSGYDYSGDFSTNASPNSPIRLDSGKGIYDSLAHYERLMDKKKLLLGVPWYGKEFPTVSDARLASKTGSPILISYENYINVIDIYGRKWDDIWKTPWYARQDTNGQWYQGHYDDLESLGIKYDLVKSEGLAGIGIWSVTHGTNRPELWRLIQDKFAFFILGESVVDEVTVIGISGVTPTGDIMFEVSNDDGKTWVQIGATKTLDSSGRAASDKYTPQSHGIYLFKAKYLGDYNYSLSASGDKDESLIVNKANPTIVTLLKQE